MHAYIYAHSQAHIYIPARMCALTSAHLREHMHMHTHARHARVPLLARRTHLRGPELQHQSPRLHLLRHAHLLQVQQVTL